MTTAFYNSCIVDITANQTNVVNCQGSENMTVDIDFKNTTDLTQDCVFNNTNVTNVTNNIKQSVAQKAKAEIQNYIAGIITAMLGVLVVVGLILFLLLLLFKSTGGKKGKDNAQPQPQQQQGGDDLFALAALSGEPVQPVQSAQTGEAGVPTGVRSPGLVSDPTSVPASLPAPHPTSVPASAPVPLPTSHPDSVPAPRPTSHPTSLPAPRPTSYTTHAHNDLMNSLSKTFADHPSTQKYSKQLEEFGGTPQGKAVLTAGENLLGDLGRSFLS